MAPSSRQPLNPGISFVLPTLKPKYTLTLYNQPASTKNTTSLDITQHESPPIQAQELNAGLLTKMKRINDVKVSAQDRKINTHENVEEDTLFP